MLLDAKVRRDAGRQPKIESLKSEGSSQISPALLDKTEAALPEKLRL
jgi:hypothetical protein